MLVVSVRARLVVRASCVGCACACVAHCADQGAHARNDKKVLPFLVANSQPYFGKKNEQQVGTHSM